MTTTTLITDTHKFISRLQEKGFSADQAKAVVETINDIDGAAIADVSGVESKFSDIKLELAKMNTKINLMTSLLVAVFAGVFVLMLTTLVG